MPRTAMRLRRWAATAVLGTLLAGCGTGGPAPDAADGQGAGKGGGARTGTDVRPIEAATRVTDAKGVTVSLEKPPEKIVCLVALCDDMLTELGMTPAATNSGLLAHPEFLGRRRPPRYPWSPAAS